MYLARHCKVQTNPETLDQSYRLNCISIQPLGYFYFLSFNVYKHKFIIICERVGRKFSKSQLKTLKIFLLIDYPEDLLKNSLMTFNLSFLKILSFVYDFTEDQHLKGSYTCIILCSISSSKRNKNPKPLTFRTLIV